MISRLAGARKKRRSHEPVDGRPVAVDPVNTFATPQGLPPETARRHGGLPSLSTRERKEESRWRSCE